ncbi:ABC transporter permease [Desulfolithobacter dissulfuricans]|uniref:ABC transporter permease n=1 Tax=Desulfolithobacter dissulfuricans TaxID=2795293 RepID=A0A915XLZ3_9BACT|nr:ABC transporter permease [Desulfolithobacter dissulfuricans]BCO10781.1 ABC transporter permease [Desulfolithobacter dissulfuricans]
MNMEIIIPLLAAAVQSGTPILYATLGEIFTERSGVLNLGVEGIMFVGALVAFITARVTGDPWLGLVAGGVSGALLAGLHGLVCLNFLGNQVVSGLALTILGTGMGNYFGTSFVGLQAPGFYPLDVPGLADLPLVGPVFFHQDLLVYCSYLLVPMLWYFFQYTRWGLRLRAAGENPDAAEAAGISVLGYRWGGILVGGFLGGLGGSYLSLAYTHLWATNITAGRGWIAVGLVIFAFWKPGRALLGAYLFGGVMAFQFRLQAMGTALPSSLLLMLPYGLTVLVLILAYVRGQGTKAPAALGVNLEPRE